jgi:EAL domain-containing protein (putative c-di-GMP-specific phosphodiesterase class I)
MKNKLVTFMKFIGSLNSDRDILFQEFLKKEELKKLMFSEKVKSVFQPIVFLEEGQTVGFEILNRPQTTPLFPTTEKFYDYVGRTRNVVTFEHFLRDLSLERYSEQIRISECHNDKLVFLNIQPQVLADPKYKSGQTLELLAKHNLSPSQIVLELTEKEAVLDYNQFERIIDHYRQQGFRIAVDDAGTGYNSLKTLVYLKPEFIKIDKSLIRNIGDHPAQKHLVGLLMEFARQSETRIIAEGIETISELRFLQNLGIHMGQGYALGRPNAMLVNGKLPLSNPVVNKRLA